MEREVVYSGPFNGITRCREVISESEDSNVVLFECPTDEEYADLMALRDLFYQELQAGGISQADQLRMDTYQAEFIDDKFRAVAIYLCEDYNFSATPRSLYTSPVSAKLKHCLDLKATEGCDDIVYGSEKLKKAFDEAMAEETPAELAEMSFQHVAGEIAPGECVVSITKMTVPDNYKDWMSVPHHAEATKRGVPTSTGSVNRLACKRRPYLASFTLPLGT